VVDEFAVLLNINYFRTVGKYKIAFTVRFLHTKTHFNIHAVVLLQILQQNHKWLGLVSHVHYAVLRVQINLTYIFVM